MGIGTDGELRLWAFARIRQAMDVAARSYEAAQSIDALAAEITARFDLSPVTFDRQQATVDDIRLAGTPQHPQQATTIVMPMGGDVDLLRRQAKKSRADLTHARISAGHVEVDVVALQITQQLLDQVIDSVVEHIGWINADLPEYREALRQGVTDALNAARAQAAERERARTELTTPTRPVADHPVTPTSSAEPTMSDSRRPVRLSTRWRTFDRSSKLAVIGIVVTLLGVLPAYLSFINDVFSFRSLWNDVFSGPPSSAVLPVPATTSTDPRCATATSRPVLQVYGRSTPARLVFQGDGFPADVTVQVSLRETSTPSSPMVAAVGNARADGCGKFSLQWTIPAGIADKKVTVAFATSPLPSSDPACCSAFTQVELSRFATGGTSPIAIVSVQHRAGDSPGSPNITVTLTGSQPPATGHIYWLCALGDGKLYPKQSVSAKDYSVPTSLGDHPATWQIVIVEANAEGSASLQSAFERDGFTEGFPTGAQSVSNQIFYHVTRS